MLPLMPLLTFLPPSPPPGLQEAPPALHASPPAHGSAGALIETRLRVAREPAAPPSVSRAQVWLTGPVSGSASWRVTLDALPGSAAGGGSAGGQAPVPLLKDAYVDAPAGPAALRLGYFKLPLAGEAIVPARELHTVRRAAYNQASAAFGLMRAPGVLLSTPEHGASFAGGVFLRPAGAAATPDLDALARVAIHPLAHTTLAFVRLLGAGNRSRQGVELDLEAERTTLHAEALAGSDGDVQRLGWSTLATWRLAPAWLAVAGLASWDDGHGGGEAASEREVTLGLNWHLANHTDLLTNLIHLVEPEGGTDDEVLVLWRLSL